MKLEEFVGDRLASGRSRQRYPRTGIAWMGRSGLSRRGAWTRRLQRLSEDPAEPNWVDSFAEWDGWFRRALDPDAPEPGADPDALTLVAIVDVAGGLKWVLHDQATSHAAELDHDPAVTGNQLAMLRDLAEVARPAMGAIPLAVSVACDPSELARLARVVDDWRPETNAFPHLSLDLPGHGTSAQPTNDVPGARHAVDDVTSTDH